MSEWAQQETGPEESSRPLTQGERDALSRLERGYPRPAGHSYRKQAMRAYKALLRDGYTVADVEQGVRDYLGEVAGREARYVAHLDNLLASGRLRALMDLRRSESRPSFAKAPACAPRTEFMVTAGPSPDVVAELPDGSHVLVCAWRAGMTRADMEARLAATSQWQAWMRGVA